MSDHKVKLDIPEAAPPTEPVKPPSKSCARRNPLLAVLFATVVVGFAAFLIITPLVNGDFKFSSKTSSSNYSGLSEDPENQGNTPTDGDERGENVMEEPEPTNGEDVTKPGDNTNPINVTKPGFDSGLPFFSENITKGYDTEEDLHDSLLLAARWLVQETMKNIGNSNDKGRDDSADVPMAGMDPPEMVASETTDTADGASTGYETNNQEVGVDEADVVKSDGTYIYAAYGDYIIVWDKQGNEVAQVAMPDIPKVQIDDPVFEDKPEPFEPVDLGSIRGSPGSASGGSSGSTGAADGGTRKKRRRTAMMIDYWNPKPRVESLVLVDGYLVAFVSGYGNSLAQMASKTSFPILYDYLNTQIRIYSLAGIADGELDFIHSKDIHGRYNDARLVGNDIHLSTLSGVDTWTTLKSPFYNQKFETDADFEAAVNKVVPDFVDRLNTELSVNGMPNLLQLSLWQTAETDDGRLVEDVLAPGTSMDNLAHVTSFTVDGGLEDADELIVSSSAFFSPSYHSYMYGTDEMIILTAEAWDWNADLGNAEQTTYLLGLELDGASTNFVSVGTLSGYLLNSYALDVVGDELRVATTIRRENWWWIEPMAMASDPLVMGVMEVNDMDTVDVAEPATVSKQATTIVAEEESSTENWMTVLNMVTSDDKMTVKGKTQIGLVNEVITSVRFYDNVAYAVTFERTDPFYVLDMNVPEVLGELKLNGFSSYLHSMNPPENTLMLAVGQDATDEGIPFGLMLTVFDAQDPTKPEISTSITIEDDDDAHSSSAAEWDYKAFRFFNGKLIIPVDIWYYTSWVMEEPEPIDTPTDPMEDETVETSRVSDAQNFVGFKVFDVTEDAITEAFDIEHSGEVGTGCHYCGGWISPRSFVFGDDVMTIRDGIVVNTGLTSNAGKENWRMSISVDDED